MPIDITLWANSWTRMFSCGYHLSPCIVRFSSPAWRSKFSTNRAISHEISHQDRFCWWQSASVIWKIYCHVQWFKGFNGCIGHATFEGAISVYLKWQNSMVWFLYVWSLAGQCLVSSLLQTYCTMQGLSNWTIHSQRFENRRFHLFEIVSQHPKESQKTSMYCQWQSAIANF